MLHYHAPVHVLAAAVAGAHRPGPAITMFQAIVLGLLQGVSELFPVSSLGHTVLFPTLFGWTRLVKAQSDPESFWLAFVVMLHVGSALGLLAYYWRDWIKIVRAWVRTLRRRRIETSTERLAWLIIAASVPTGILGLLLEHPVRVELAKPMAAAIFLTVNGVMLLGAERLRRGPRRLPAARERGRALRSDRPLDAMGYAEAGGIGVAQSLALIAGISRDGVVMTAGLVRGLDHEDSARFAFLLATPIILAAGVFKLSDLLGPLGNGIRAQSLVAAASAAVAAVACVAFLVRWFRTRTLTPFGVYCVLFGAAMIAYLGVR